MTRPWVRLLARLRASARGLIAASVVAALPLAAVGQGPGPDFDHLPTGFPLTGAHKSAKCETCHDKGIFKGTPKTCEACHAPGARLSSVIEPTTHAPTTQRCDLCHTTVTFTGARWNHTGAQPGACATCHNGTTAPGKSAGHLQTTQSCDVCHRTSAWTPAGYDHTGIVGGCATCHNGSTALGKSRTHIPTTASCESCHTSTTVFATWTMNHAGIVNGCAACHGGQFGDVVAKPSTHIPTSATCETCHTSTTSFKRAVFDHAGIVNGCANCHNGASATGKPSTHIPTNMPCETCHTGTTAFTAWTMNHTQIVSGCAQCHGGQFPDVTAKPANHVQTTAPCENCHTNFTTFKGATFNHAGITGQCANCHNGNTALGMPANHVPTNQPCETCHSATSFTTFAGGTMSHTGITSGCATCHAAGSSFFGVTVKTPPATHIPFAGAACEACHTPANFTAFSGTAMNHAPVAGISCATCHETGKSFFGVTIVTRPTLGQDPNHPQTGDCGSCHTTASFNGAVGKPANHLPTTQPCSLCHSNPGDYSVATMNHAGIASGCATCHAPGSSFANVVPVAPPATHFPTPMPCETCHAASNFTTFGGTAMNHAGITANCANCHAPGKSFFGVTMKTPPATHIPFAGAACEACHTPANFTAFSGTAMNHAPVAGISCATCHETGKSFFGVTIVTRPTLGQDPNHPQTGDCGSCHTTASFNGAVGKPANHLPTTQPCSLCHSNPGDYSVATMNHAGIASGCATCHAPGSSFANVVPVAPPATHFPTPMPCETCHAASNFTTFGGTAMNHAGITANCANCHAPGKSFFGVTMKTPPATHFPTPMPCETCHAASNFTTFAGTSMNHAGITANCATCHAAGSSFFGVTMKTPPATHIPTDAPCEVCHAASNFTTFAGTAMNHAGINGNCANCHAAGKSFFGVTVKTPPATHIPFGGAACEACHAQGNFTSFSGTPMNHAPVAGLACSSCHNTGMSWFGVTIVTKPTPTQDPNHPVTSQDCGGCHTSTTSFNTVTGKPANHLPTSQPCTLCHSNPNDYSVGTMNHAGISSGCATCHAPGSSFANIVPKTPPATHFPTPMPCETCHVASNFTTFAGTSMNHAGITANCATCHAAGSSFFGVTMKTPPATHIPTAAPCEVCHAASNFTTFAGTAMNHAGIASGCATCHASGLSFFGVTVKTPPANHIPTSKACETCHAASNFTSFAGTSMNHAGITANCATCHAAGSSFFGVTMKTPPATHIPFAGAACEACHAPGNYVSFAGTPMNHAAVSGMACTTCHETGKSFFGVTIVTRPTLAQDPNHPTTGDCGSCHTTATFNGAVGKPANHLPTSQPCSLCHSNPSNYSVGTMNHAGITTGCATCHAAGSSFANVVPVAPPANHIPTARSCETCHAASNFTSFAGTSMNHAGITSGCATCHAAGSSFFGVTMKTPPATHIPFAGAACESCHAPANFTSFTGTPMNHAAVSGMACTTCHETGKSFFGVTIVTRPTLAQDPNHPQTGDCGNCHSTTTFNGAVGKPANHLPTSQPCSLCHSNPNDYSVGTMNHAGITTGCATCHAAGSSFANVVPKAPPANHIPTAKPCETCHAASNFTTFAGTTMNHAGITSGCSTCHAAGLSFFGVTVKAPPPTHIPFNNAACEACHAPANFASFAGTPMNHAAVTSMKCMSCHEFGMSWFGVHIVTRPGANHHPGQDCGGCHTTSSFDSGDKAALLKRLQVPSPTSGVNGPGPAPRTTPLGNVHLGIAPGGCATCHNGATARAKSARHVMTTLSCDACHRTTTWTPASFTHAATAPGTCMSCHNASLAKGKAASHFVTVRSCDACHRATSWATVRYQHVSPAYREHGPNVSCSACHKTNAEAVVWTSPAFKPDCAGCHADRFRPQQHPKPGLGGGLHTMVELRDCTGSCHLGSGPAKAPKTFVSRHRPSDGSF